MAQTREHRPRGERFEAASDSLEYFLTERDCLYTLDEHLRVLRAEIALRRGRFNSPMRGSRRTRWPTRSA